MQITHVEASYSHPTASSAVEAAAAPATLAAAAAAAFSEENPPPAPAAVAAVAAVGEAPPPLPGEKRKDACSPGGCGVLAAVDGGLSPLRAEEADEALKPGDAVVVAPAIFSEGEVGEGEEAASRSKVAVATKTTRQTVSSKLLKRLPLHWRKKSSALGCVRSERG